MSFGECVTICHSYTECKPTLAELYSMFFAKSLKRKRQRCMGLCRGKQFFKSLALCLLLILAPLMKKKSVFTSPVLIHETKPGSKSDAEPVQEAKCLVKGHNVRSFNGNQTCNLVILRFFVTHLQDQGFPGKYANLKQFLPPKMEFKLYCTYNSKFTINFPVDFSKM